MNLPEELRAGVSQIVRDICDGWYNYEEVGIASHGPTEALYVEQKTSQLADLIESRIEQVGMIGKTKKVGLHSELLCAHKPPCNCEDVGSDFHHRPESDCTPVFTFTERLEDVDSDEEG